MADDLRIVEDYVGGLVAKLSAAQRRKLAMAIAVSERRANAQRIAAQKDPDGKAFVPRKAASLRGKVGRIRRADGMFKKLRQARYFSAEATPEAAFAGFANATAARIARVHQGGLRDRVTRESGSAVVRYPERRLLGVSDEDRARILDLVLQHIEG